jgi:hypothetical protein
MKGDGAETTSRRIREERAMNTFTLFRSGGRRRLGRAVCAAFLLVAVGAVDAAAQAFVTGSGNTPGFSIVGRVRVLKSGRARGSFLIVVHRDQPEFTTAAAVCSYREFDNVVINNNLATFHSVGQCVALTTNGLQQSFTSDNVFSITDNGQPEPGADSIDVNFLGPSGVAIPGGVLLHGNFIVTP